MATLTKGYNFVTNDVVTPTKLNNLVDSAQIANIANADISATAGIAHSKLATLAGGAMIVGSSTNVPTARTISGDVTVSNTGAVTIANNAVTSAKLRDSASLSVIGRSADSIGDPDDIRAATDGHVLRRSGNTLGFGTLSALAFPSNFPIQMVQAVKSDTQEVSESGNVWEDITGLSLTLTRLNPSASGKVRIQAVIHNSTNNSNNAIFFQILRGSTAIGIGAAAGNRLRATAQSHYPYSDYSQACTTIDFIDNSPGSSETVTYKIQARTWSTVKGWINRSNNDADAADYIARTISTLTLTELAP